MRAGEGGLTATCAKVAMALKGLLRRAARKHAARARVVPGLEAAHCMIPPSFRTPTQPLMTAAASKLPAAPPTPEAMALTGNPQQTLAFTRESWWREKRQDPIEAVPTTAELAWAKGRGGETAKWNYAKPGTVPRLTTFRSDGMISRQFYGSDKGTGFIRVSRVSEVWGLGFWV